ncbi:MAG: hypothetical protein AAF743_00925 [Planctomycetota bacterium]
MLICIFVGCGGKTESSDAGRPLEKRPAPTTQLSWDRPLDTTAIPAEAQAIRPVAIGTPPLVWQVNGPATARIVHGTSGDVLLEAPVNTGDLVVVSESLIRIGETRGTVRGNPDTRYLIYLDQTSPNETRRTRQVPTAP